MLRDIVRFFIFDRLTKIRLIRTAQKAQDSPEYYYNTNTPEMRIGKENRDGSKPK